MARYVRAMTSVLWLRRDLRIDDHPALHAAADDGPVLPLFVRDPRLANAGDARRSRLEASLAAFDATTDGALVVRSGDPAEVVASVVEEVGAQSVHVTGEFTPYARRRDRRVADRAAGGRHPDGRQRHAIRRPTGHDPRTRPTRPTRCSRRTPGRGGTTARSHRWVARAGCAGDGRSTARPCTRGPARARPVVRAGGGGRGARAVAGVRRGRSGALLRAPRPSRRRTAPAGCRST